MQAFRSGGTSGDNARGRLPDAAALLTVAAALGCAPASRISPTIAQFSTAATGAAEAGARSVPEVPKEVVEGGKLYRTKGCQMCHGVGAKGGVPNRYSKSGMVPALDKVSEGYSEASLRKTISRGISKVTPAKEGGHVPILIMPRWKDVLSDAELNSITAYLFHLSKPKEEARAPEASGATEEYFMDEPPVAPTLPAAAKNPEMEPFGDEGGPAVPETPAPAGTDPSLKMEEF